MAKTFDPSQLSPADRAAFAGWQQQLQQYVAQSGGGVPAPVTYALAHPDYLQSHPELREAYNLVSGASLPSTTREALKGFHPTWGGGQAGMGKDSGLWSKWETWLQLGLAGAVAAPAIVGAAGAGAAGAGAGSASGAAGGGAAAGGGTIAGLGAAPALEGGGTLAANLGGAGALGAGGAAAGGATAAGAGATLASTPMATSYVAPAAASTGIGGAGATGAAGAAASTPFWKKILPDIIGAGANLAGNAIQSNQVNKAVQAQVDAANRQLELQGNIYRQQRADLAPYRNLGSGASTLLAQGLGLPAAQDTTIPAFQQQSPQQTGAPMVTGPTGAPAPHDGNPNNAPVVGQAVPRQSLAGLSGSGFVNMISPDGRPARVPQAQAQAALAAGGRMA